jgi:hypothetical protein
VSAAARGSSLVVKTMPTLIFSVVLGISMLIQRIDSYFNL